MVKHGLRQARLSERATHLSEPQLGHLPVKPKPNSTSKERIEAEEDETARAASALPSLTSEGRAGGLGRSDSPKPRRPPAQELETQTPTPRRPPPLAAPKARRAPSPELLSVMFEPVVADEGSRGIPSPSATEDHFCDHRYGKGRRARSYELPSVLSAALADDALYSELIQEGGASRVVGTDATEMGGRTPSSVPISLRWESDATALANIPTLDWTHDVGGLGDGCITALFLDVCRRHHVLDDLASDGLGLHMPKLHAYFGHLEDHYGNNPYHNKHHAADVTLGVHRFLAERWARSDAMATIEASVGATATREVANVPPPLFVPSDAEDTAAGSWPSSMSGGGESSTNGFALSPLQIFAGLFAAAIHDFNHPGTSNSHEIGKDSKLAVLYHDESVLESHHLASAFSALLTPHHNFLSGWDRKAYVEFRQIVVQLVLMTDLSKHFDFVSKLNTLKTGSLQPTKAPDPTLILTLAIKGADLGHPVKPWPLHLRWSQVMNEEFFLLGDREREEGLPISTFCDRDKDANLAKSQLGFLKFVCQPFYVAAVRVLVDEPAANAVSRLDANIKEWESYGEPQAALEDTSGSSSMSLST